MALENVSFSTEEYKQIPSDFCIHPSIFCQNTLQFLYFVNDCISTWNAFLLNLHLFNQRKATLNKAYRNLHLYSFVCVFCRTNLCSFFLFLLYFHSFEYRFHQIFCWKLNGCRSSNKHWSIWSNNKLLLCNWVSCFFLRQNLFHLLWFFILRLELRANKGIFLTCFIFFLVLFNLIWNVDKFYNHFCIVKREIGTQDDNFMAAKIDKMQQIICRLKKEIKFRVLFCIHESMQTNPLIGTRDDHLNQIFTQILLRSSILKLFVIFKPMFFLPILKRQQ